MTGTNARVISGALLLDRRMPNWYNNVNLETLVMSEPNQCVLGQLYGDFGTGLIRLDIDYPHNAAAKYGFDIGFWMSKNPFITKRESAFKALTEAWTHEINVRRGE